MTVDVSSPPADELRLLIYPVERERPAPDSLIAHLRRVRTSQGLTLEWVADRVGVTKQAISDFETDTTGRKQPSEETLRKWLRALEQPQDLADEWVEFQIGEKVRELLAARRGPRAASPEDIEAAVRYVRRLFGR